MTADRSSSPRSWKSLRRAARGHARTASIDYALILEGEVFAVLDTEETLLKAGDVLIQRGTNHAWANRSDRICRIAFILIDADDSGLQPTT